LYRGQVIGWTGLIKVDGKTLVWMGAPRQVTALVDQISYEYTSTSSIFTFTADTKVKIKVTFLSPLFPTDFKRQSLVYSYMNVEVSSLDSLDHDVQIYTDISAGKHSCICMVCPPSRLIMCRMGFWKQRSHGAVGDRYNRRWCLLP